MIYHDVKQNEDAWSALRLGKATGSNSACYMANDGRAFGDPAKAYALKIALEIKTGKAAEYSFSNDHMIRGQEQEPIARMLYEEENFLTIGNGGFFDCGRHGDSPDGLILKDGVLEIKCVIATTHYATMLRDSFDPAHRWQLVSHLDCSERNWVDFVSYCSDFPEDKQMLVYRLYREECKVELERLAARRHDFLELVDSTLRNIQ